MGLVGPCIYDIAEHFVLRWNFCKRDKYKRDDRYDWLTMTGRTGEDEDLVGVQRPKHPVGEYIHHPLTPLEGKRGDPRPGRTAQHPQGQHEVVAGEDSDENSVSPGITLTHMATFTINTVTAMASRRDYTNVVVLGRMYTRAAPIATSCHRDYISTNTLMSSTRKIPK